MFVLEEGQLVVVSPPDVRTSEADNILYPFEAMVVGLDQRVVSLMTLNHAPLLWWPKLLRDVLLAPQAERRMVALRGTVRYGRETEHLRFRVDDASFRAPWPSSRLELRTPVALLTGEGGDDEEAHKVLTHDVGPDGVLLHESTELALCGTVAVRLTCPATTSRCSRSGACGRGCRGAGPPSTSSASPP